MSGETAGERYERMCPTHGRLLLERGSQLYCPMGDHAVARWKVVDRKLSRAVSVADAEAGELREIREELKPMERSTTPPPKQHGRLQFAKYSCAAATLAIRLEKTKPGRLKVTWVRVSTEGKRSSAYLYDGTDWDKAVKAYNDAQTDAQRRGWVEAPASARIKFEPIPDAAPPRAGAELQLLAPRRKPGRPPGRRAGGGGVEAGS